MPENDDRCDAMADIAVQRRSVKLSHKPKLEEIYSQFVSIYQGHAARASLSTRM
jgi:hypothetical protein